MKTAYDLNHVKSVSAIALLYKGEYAGRIVCNWSDNPMGSVCTATVSIWSGPLAQMTQATGRAGGYGYDKKSSAIYDALTRAYFMAMNDCNVEQKKKDGKTAAQICDVSPGTGNERSAFEAIGYTWIDVI